MKTRLNSHFLAGLFLLLAVESRAQSQQAQGYTINGTIKGLKSGKVKLVRNNQEDRTSMTIDSTGMKEGRFTLKGKAVHPEMMTLLMEPGNWSVPVFVEKGVITVKADTTGSQHYDWTAYSGSKGAQIINYTVSGSESQASLKKYDNAPALKVYEPAFARLNKAYSEAAGDKEKAYQIKEEMDGLREQLTALQLAWIDSFISANPASPAGAYLLNNHYLFNRNMPLATMESLMGKFTEAAKSTVYYDILSKAMVKRKALQPGNAAPDFTLRKPDSSMFTLSALRGQYVVLDFWASWCVPCRKAIPHWKEVYEKYHTKGLEIVSITNDSRWSDWFKALEAEKMPWLQVADEFPKKLMPARLATQYMIPYLPTYVLLDKGGNIVLHNGTEQQIEDKLKEIFGS